MRPGGVATLYNQNTGGLTKVYDATAASSIGSVPSANVISEDAISEVSFTSGGNSGSYHLGRSICGCGILMKGEIKTLKSSNELDTLHWKLDEFAASFPEPRQVQRVFPFGS